MMKVELGVSSVHRYLSVSIMKKVKLYTQLLWDPIKPAEGVL